jgi:hypothetical protein
MAGGSVAETISVVGWDRFQHYKDRDPPWVKLYRDLFTSESWVLGTDTSRLVQVASILLAARYSNKIPMQWKLIRKVASLDCSEKDFNAAVSHLCATKFFEIQSLPEAQGMVAQPASTMLATCNTETEQSRDRAEQREKAQAPPPEGLDLQAWNRWEAYKREIRKPIKPASLLAAQRKLAGFGSDQAAVVEHSIAQGWTGLYAAKEMTNGTRGYGAKPSAVEAVNRATAEWAQQRGVDPASI